MPGPKNMAAAVVLGAVAAAAGLPAVGAPPPPATAPPPLEPVRVETVPVPDDLRSAIHPRWTPDGDHIVFEFTSDAESQDQLGVIAIDGSGFRCLTCGLDQVTGLDRPFNTLEPLNIGKPFVFSDGKRVMARIPGRSDRQSPNPLSGPTSDFNYVILECEPSVLSCDQRRLLPLELPGPGLSRGVQNREGRLSPDGRYFAWTEVNGRWGAGMMMARLVREPDRYTVADVKLLNPSYRIGYPPLHPAGGAQDWQKAGPLYELKQFDPQGRTVTYAAASRASNFDVWELDLATSERRRLTDDIDWDEDAHASPDGAWMGMFRGRGLDRMHIWSKLVRPEFIEFVTFPQIGRYMLTEGNRKCLIEPWLVDRAGDQGTYGGQPLNSPLEEGWTSSPVLEWNPAGNSILFWEDAWDHTGKEEAGEATSRLRVAHLPARPPRPIEPPPATAFPVWAPSRGYWDGIADEQVPAHTVAGLHSGTATLTYVGQFFAGAWRVEYDSYSDDGEWVVTGTEEVQTPNPIAVARYVADLRLTGGAHTGFMSADVMVRPGGAAEGTVVTEVDGQRLEGLPTPDECPSLGHPQLEGAVVSLRAAGPDAARVTIQVTSRIVHDPVDRPVRYVLVEGGVRPQRTDEAGRATVVVRGLAGGSQPLRLSADGFQDGAVAVTSP